MELIWSAKTGFGSHPDHRSAAVLDRPRRILNRFGRCALWKCPCELVYTMCKSLVVCLEHSAQENVNLKHRVSPGAYHCSGPQTIGRFGANTSGDDYTPGRARKYAKFPGSPCLSTTSTFIPCGLTISSRGLTSIFCHNCYSP